MSSTTAPPDGATGTAPSRAPVDFTDPLESEHAFRIALAWRELRRGASAAALRDPFFGTGDDALDPGQMDTLDLLIQRPEWRMSELAEALRVDPSTATRAVQRLVNDGLAERQPSGADGRVVMVVASAEGRRRHEDVAMRRVHAMGRLLAVFDATERADLADLMMRFVHSLDDLVAELVVERAADEQAAATAES